MKVFYIFFISVLLVSTATAQTSYQILKGESSLFIQGTSSLHDWESVAEDFNGSADITLEEGMLSSIDKLTFSVTTESIKSGKRIMDRKTRDALKSKDHTEIVFSFLSVEDISSDSISVKGSVFIAGVSKELLMSGAYQMMDGGRITIEGSTTIDMEEFGISPPTAMMGTLKTGKEVIVQFQIIFSEL